MAHVRAATSGNFDVAEDNCHPFRCGPFAFMHNGDIPAFSKIRRPLMESLSDEGFAMVRGNTDSEHMFALAMEHLRGREDDSSCELLAEALHATVTGIVELLERHAPGTHAYLNLVLTDGHKRPAASVPMKTISTACTSTRARVIAAKTGPATWPNRKHQPGPC